MKISFIRRFITSFGFFAMLMIHVSASATPGIAPVYVKWHWSGVTDYYSTASDACFSSSSAQSVGDVVVNSIRSAASASCTLTGGFQTSVSSAASCADGSALQADSGDITYCAPPVCPTGMSWNGTACTQPNGDTCPSGQHTHLTSVVPSGTISACQAGPSPCPDGQTHLDNSCAIPACPSGQHHDSTNQCVPDLVDCPGGGRAHDAASCTKFVCPNGDTIENGQCVSPTDAPPKVTNPLNGCPAGTVNIGTASDGTPMCKSVKTDTPLVDNNPKTTDAPTKTTTNPDGSTTTTDQSSVKNSDGSTTTKTTNCTTDSSGSRSCQTGTTTSANSSGGPGKSDGGLGGGGGTGNGAPGGDDKNDLCAKHPNLNVCSNSGVTGGGCTGAVSTTACTGDAIQCAMLRQMRDENCSNLQASPLKDLGNNLLAGNDPMQAQIDANKKGDTVDLSGQALDSSGFLGGGACFADRTISVSGRSVAVSFTGGCTAIQGLRYGVLACALVVAYLLVSKSVIQGA